MCKMKENNILDKTEKVQFASFMKFSKSGKHDFSNICDSEKQCFIDDCNYLSWDYLIPVFEKLTRDFDISWRISSDCVRTNNPKTNTSGCWEINCPDYIIIDAYRAAISNIKSLTNI